MKICIVLSVQCFMVFHVLSHVLPHLILRTTLEVVMADVVIIPISEEETEPKRSMLTYLSKVIQLISGRRGLGIRFPTLTSSTLIIIYLIFGD